MFTRRNYVNKIIFASVAVFLLAYIGLRFPIQLPVVAFKAAIVTLAAIIGYWLDYILNYTKMLNYHDKLEHTLDENNMIEVERALIIGASISRSLLIMACILGMSLAV